METKSLLYGLIGFFIGGFIVAVAATNELNGKKPVMNDGMGSMDQSQMAWQDKTGDEYDKAFIENMIVHHQGAIDMAKVAQRNAKHDEIKQLSKAIVTAQEKEINEMKLWQVNWGYSK